MSEKVKHAMLLLLLVLCLIAGPGLPGGFAAPAPAFADMEGHWAAELANDWVELGLIMGYPDGTFGPERHISRAEVCALLNRVLGFTATVAELPADVDPAAWHAEDISRALAARYLEVDGAGRVYPEGLPTRQEMAAMIVSAFRLEHVADVGWLEQFADHDEVGAKYAWALAELVAAGHLLGFPDGTLRPAAATNRAQAVALIARVTGRLIREIGIYPPPDGRRLVPTPVTVTASPVVLRDMLIAGDLHIIAPEHGVRLENLIVLGRVTVLGAGTLELADTQITHLQLTDPEVVVRASGASYIVRTLLPAGGTLVGVDPETMVFESVVVHGGEDRVASLTGQFGFVTVREGPARLILASGSVSFAAVVEASADGSVVNLHTGTSITQLLLHAPTRVVGQGGIEELTVLASGSEVETEPEHLMAIPGVSVMVAGVRHTGQAAIVLEYAFDDGPDGWTGDFCDLPVDYDQESYELQFRWAGLPEEVGPGHGLFIAGKNISDDLFMFIKRSLGVGEGIQANTKYAVVIEIDLATNAPAGVPGVGGAPGEGLFAKVGAAAQEPVPVITEVGHVPYYVLNVDKGAQNDDGRNAVLVGDGAKSSDEWDWSYEIKTMSNASRPLAVETGSDGVLWVFAGTDSGFEGLSELYYARVRVTLLVTVAG